MNVAQKLSPHIEFFGFPGSGKTTLARCVEFAVKDENLHVVGRDDVRSWLARQKRVKKAVMTAKHAPNFLSDAMIYEGSVAGDSQRKSRWNMAAKGAMLRVYLDQFRRESRCDLIVLDEWSIQWFWAMSLLSRVLETKLLRDRVRKYLRRSAPTLIVYLDAQPEVASRRVHARVGENTVFDNRPVEEVEHRLKESVEAMQAIIGAIRGEGCTLITIDAMASTEANTKKILMKAADLRLLDEAVVP